MVGVGLIVGTQAVHRAAKGRSMVDVVTAGLFGLGAGAALLGGFHSKFSAALSTLTIGAAISFVMVPAQTLSQKETPPAMQGRVSSTFMSLFSISQVLGLSLSGVLAARLGIRQLFLTAAAALMVLSLAGFVWLRAAPATRRKRAGARARRPQYFASSSEMRRKMAGAPSASRMAWRNCGCLNSREMRASALRCSPAELSGAKSTKKR